MKISVIIPTYNAARWVGRAVESVLRQSKAVAEIIVVDDGSTDNTSTVLERFRGSVKYIRQENQGSSAARNTGMDKATSEWFAFLDSDDEWLEEKVAGDSQTLLQSPGLRWCFTRPVWVKQQAGKVASCPRSLRKHIEEHGSVGFFYGLRRGLQVCISGMTIHRSTIEDVGGFNRCMFACEDLDMWCRIALRSPEVGYCLNPGVRYQTDTPGSLTKGKYPRDRVLRSLLENLARAKADVAGIDQLSHFRTYAKHRTIRLLLRAAGGEILLGDAVIHEATCAFELTPKERMLLRVLRRLPKPLATRIVNRLVP